MQQSFVESRDMSLRRSFGDVQTHIHPYAPIERDLSWTSVDPMIWDFRYLKSSTCVKEGTAHGMRTLVSLLILTTQRC